MNILTGLMSSLTGTLGVEVCMSMQWGRLGCWRRSPSWSSSTSASMSSFSIQFGWQVHIYIDNWFFSNILHISSPECQQSAWRENIGFPRRGKGKGPSELSELVGTTGHSSSKPCWPCPDLPLPEVLPSMEKNPCCRGARWKGSHLPENNKRRAVPNDLREHLWNYLDVNTCLLLCNIRIKSICCWKIMKSYE